MDAEEGGGVEGGHAHEEPGPVPDHLEQRPVDAPWDESDASSECLALGRQYHLQRRIHSAASCSKVLIQSAMRLADNRGLLEPDGPDAARRGETRRVVVVEARDARDCRVVLRATTPEPYTLSAWTACDAVRRTLAGQRTAGTHTPAAAFGEALALAADGVGVETLALPSVE